jgi:phosphoglycerate kinase
MEDCKNTKICSVAEGIDDDLAGYDIGPQSIDLFTKVILSSKTVFWNGPPGVFENETFSKGSIAFVNSFVELTKKGGVTIVGGGETVNAVKLVKGAENEIAHVSTGGGASLELMEGRTLPGVVFLSEK